MDNRNSCYGSGCVRKELVRILIERIQGMKRGDDGKRESAEPEKQNPVFFLFCTGKESEKVFPFCQKKAACFWRQN